MMKRTTFDHPRLALFDLDGTLLPIDSNRAFGNHLVDLGWIDRDTWARRNEEFVQAHDRGQLDLVAFIDFATAAWRDRPDAEADEVRASFVADVVRPALPDSARRLVNRHKEAGDLVALVTGTNEFLAEPIARELGVDHVLAVQLERDPDGRVTGKIRGVPSFHSGKVTRVQQWLLDGSRTLADFETVTFYGDSVNDVPLMEVVSHPVVVNPKEGLRELAIARGWPVISVN